MEDMQRVVELLQERYGKKVFIAETSYGYTFEDGMENMPLEWQLQQRA
ncbi:MAG: glycosyl hydrolase 53 family protein [Lachnospiraceae bacterium]|nr:glycosyl hydrolase 53 family protein [Lachnospiraceae bacterium]